jgi:hypothetical protein
MAHLKRMFQTSKHPFVVTPGDNEWTDCHKRKVNPFDPLERLAKVRDVFFPNDQSLDQRLTRVEVFGSPDVHWVRIVVEPDNPSLFVIRPEIVEANLVNHVAK